MNMMKTSLFRVVSIGMLILLLLACSSSSGQSEEELPLTASLGVSGAHLVYGNNPPQGFQILTETSEIRQLHENGEDVWFYVQVDDLDRLDAEENLRVWLAVKKALHLSAENASLFWIPADPEVDRLAFAEKTNLTDAIEPIQQAQLWRQRGDQLRIQGSFDAAITAYERSLALNPKEAEPYAGLGAAHMGKGQNETALAAFKTAIELAPDHYWAHRLLGHAYLNLQRYTQAADELTQAYILRPQDSNLLIGIALGQGRSGHSDQAIRTLELLFSSTDDPQLHRDGELLFQEFSENHQTEH